MHAKEFLFKTTNLLFPFKDEMAEGEDANKADGENKKTPSTSTLFDDEVDSKANVLKKAEELRQQGCKQYSNRVALRFESYECTISFTVGTTESSNTNNLFGSKIKEEPIDYDEDDDVNSDEYGDDFGDSFGNPYDEFETFAHSKSLDGFVTLMPINISILCLCR